MKLSRNSLFNLFYVLVDDKNFPIKEVLDKRFLFTLERNIESLRSEAESILKFRTKVIEDLKVLSEEPKDTLEQRKKDLTDSFNDILDEEVECNISKVSFKYLPNQLSSIVFNAMRPMIKETDEEIATLIESE